jgi:actin related protein 2/3 complex subunit 1A/1B
VTSIDWSDTNNKIVSCSHDRNAFVWTFEAPTTEESAQWKPALVLLRIDRAAMCVRWSLDGLRFAVGSGAKCIPVCTYDGSNDWWVSKHIKKKIKSTVTCISFHPTNGQMLATGCSDFKCRIYSTYSSDVDGSNSSDVNPLPYSNPVEFGEIYGEFSATGWINAVEWSPSGNLLAFASHDSTITVVHFNRGEMILTLKSDDLPLSCLQFINEGTLIGAGYNYNPTVFKYTTTNNTWAYDSNLDSKRKSIIVQHLVFLLREHCFKIEQLEHKRLDQNQMHYGHNMRT